MIISNCIHVFIFQHLPPRPQPSITLLFHTKYLTKRIFGGIKALQTFNTALTIIGIIESNENPEIHELDTMKEYHKYRYVIDGTSFIKTT